MTIQPLESNSAHPGGSPLFNSCYEIYRRADTQSEAACDPAHFECLRNDLLLRRPDSQKAKSERAQGFHFANASLDSHGISSKIHHRVDMMKRS